MARVEQHAHGDVALHADFDIVYEAYLVVIGDSGGNQKGMEAVADDLNAKWSGGKTRI